MLYSMSSSRAEKTKTAILDAARSLFEAQGYFGVGLEAVAAQAGVSRQAIYLHYASKAELLRALHDRINVLYVRPAFEAVWNAATADEALDAWIEGSAFAIPQFLDISNALNAARRSDPDVEATWETPARTHYEDCVRLAERLKRDKKLAPRMKVSDAADIIWMQTGIWAFESLIVDRGWPVSRWVRWQKQTLRELLGWPPKSVN